MTIPRMSAKKNPSATSLSNTKISLSVLALIIIGVTTPLCAQQVSTRSLSLAEALDIARENNPSFLQSRNDESLSDWDVRQAYAALYQVPQLVLVSHGKDLVSSNSEA